MIKKYWLTAAASLIIILGAVVRLGGLEVSPPSLGFDEASLGYNAFSIMKTGRDEYGNWMPISLRSFNDYKPALYAYLIIPFIKIYGLTATAVRAPSALAGTISLIFLFFFLRKFIKNKWCLLLVFGMLSFEPWRLHFSRNALETNLSAMFFLIAVWLLIEAKSRLKLFWSTVFFGLSAYSYHSARLAAPLLLLFWAIDPIGWVEGKKKKIQFNKLWPIGLFFLWCVPIFVANNGNLLLTRFNQENVFSRFYPYAPKEVLPLIASPVYYFMGIVSGHVLSYISPINLSQRIFLWVKESPQFIPGMGMIGRLESILFIFGFLYLLKNLKKSPEMRLIAYWIIAGAAPAAATWTWFHPLRSLNIYPAIEILAAIGAKQVLFFLNNLIKNKIIKIIGLGAIVVLAAITSIFTLNNELLYSAYENHGEYQPGGFKEGMTYFKSLQENYDQVIVDTPHAQGFVFLLFYEAFDPKIIQEYANIRPRPGVVGNLNFDFGKFRFRKIDWPKDKNLHKTLFWGSAEITRREIEAVPGAKLRMIVPNALYDAAAIITID